MQAKIVPLGLTPLTAIHKVTAIVLQFNAKIHLVVCVFCTEIDIGIIA